MAEILFLKIVDNLSWYSSAQ